MNLPQVVSREEWLAARKELLAKEKELTRQRDTLAAERRRLPMVKIDQEYLFEGPDGKVTLLNLFDGRRQLIVYHFRFSPEWDEGCPSCSARGLGGVQGSCDRSARCDPRLLVVNRDCPRS